MCFTHDEINHEQRGSVCPEWTNIISLNPFTKYMFFVMLMIIVILRENMKKWLSLHLTSALRHRNKENFTDVSLFFLD